MNLIVINFLMIVNIYHRHTCKHMVRNLKIQVSTTAQSAAVHVQILYFNQKVLPNVLGFFCTLLVKISLMQDADLFFLRSLHHIVKFAQNLFKIFNKYIKFQKTNKITALLCILCSLLPMIFSFIQNTNFYYIHKHTSYIVL